MSTPLYVYHYAVEAPGTPAHGANLAITSTHERHAHETARRYVGQPAAVIQLVSAELIGTMPACLCATRKVAVH